MEYNLGSGEPEGIPASALEGVVTSYHRDENADEWVVRIHHRKGIQSVCGCPGEIEAKMVAASIAAVASVADTTFTLKSGGGEPGQVECNNLVEFDGMRDTTSKAIDLVLDFIEWRSA